MVYDALNRAVTITLGNSATARSVYNNAGWLTTLRNAKSDGTVLSVFTYAYDNIGNRTSVQEASGDRVTWSYDAIYQLTRERRSGANSYDITYTYDATGNRLTKVDSGTPTTYTYNAANRLTTEQAGANLTTYSYDNNGNTTLKNAAGQRTTFTWDHENRLTKLEQPTSPAVMTFTYDGQSFRRTLHNGTSLSKFLNDWQTGTPGLAPVLMETDGAGTATATYTYGLGLVSQRRAATTNYCHYEAIGTTRQLTDANQAATDTYVFDAWGNQINSGQPTTNPYRYVGKEGYYSNGQSGLALLGIRYYDAGLGRFFSMDPVRDRANWFIYAGNDPINQIDPAGLRCTMGMSDRPECRDCHNWWNGRCVQPRWTERRPPTRTCRAQGFRSDQCYCLYWWLLFSANRVGGSFPGLRPSEHRFAHTYCCELTCQPGQPCTGAIVYNVDNYNNPCPGFTFPGGGAVGPINDPNDSVIPCVQECFDQHESDHVRQCEESAAKDRVIRNPEVRPYQAMYRCLREKCRAGGCEGREGVIRCDPYPPAAGR